jgi:hypothetical protein
VGRSKADRPQGPRRRRQRVGGGLHGDPVALVGVLDYVAQQTVGVGFFDMLQGLKLADRLGLGWYDEVISKLHRAPTFPQVAQAIGDFANTIDDLDVLKQVGQLDTETGGAYRILNGNAGEVMDNFTEKWGATVRNIGPERWQVTSPDGATILTHYPSESLINAESKPTIFINESGVTQKVRFGSSIYYAD